MNKRYDVAIIGSGFGGSIVGCRLAQAGRSVCILERGRRWENTEFPRSPAEFAQDAFWDVVNRRFGFLQYQAFPGMHVIHGCGVGGGSLHYFNVHIRPPASIFADPRWPATIDLKVLDPYYRLARDMLDAEPLSPPSERQLPNRTTVFQDACRALGREADIVDIAVYTGSPRQNPHGNASQLPCDYSGDCLLGCATHAKNTLDLNYLPLAERHGASIFPLHSVNCMRRLEAPASGYRITFDRRDPDAPERTDAGYVDAETVVVAAGTLGTNELLLRCRDVHGTLPELSAALGRGFSGNGDLLLAGTMTELDVNASRGPSITAGADFASPRQEAYVEDLGFPDELLWFIEGMLANATPTVNLFRWGELFVGELLDRRGMSMRGATSRISRERQRLFRNGRTRRYLPYLGMCEDAADGQLALDRHGQLDLRWNPRASLKNIEELETAMRQLSRALDGEYLPSPLWSPPLRELLTAHPLGGCAMSDDPSSGVVDEYGKVYHYPGLYIADASIIPTALARNPTATISALAERVAFHLVHGRELHVADDATPSNRWPDEPERPAGPPPPVPDLIPA
jgi:cholesterol oxidase